MASVTNNQALIFQKDSFSTAIDINKPENEN